MSRLFVCNAFDIKILTDDVDLSDILPTSYHAVVDTGVEKGDVVGVWG
jgi:threonine dehydrogenase-like Zn-dependent dehydrogenase